MITEIKGLDKLTKITCLILNNNQITKMQGLSNLNNLKKLYLQYNKITEISDLNSICLQKLWLYNNQISEIKGLNTLVDLQDLKISSNQISEIKGIDNLINLDTLCLGGNQITEIKGLDNLTNLKTLNLNFNNITEIKGLDTLVKLEELGFYNNQITEIKGLDNLVNLKNLELTYNKITEIKGIDNLVNLEYLRLDNNQITELSLSLCNLRNLKWFTYYNNPIKYIPLPVQRLLDLRERNLTKKNIVYNTQNVHNYHVQNRFYRSLENILRDKYLLTINVVKNDIINDEILTEQTKREILNYCDDTTCHASYLITYADLLVYVWSRIYRSVDKIELCKVLNQEIKDGLCMYFTGRMTRLLNCLSGFYDDIELQISDSEQITNIIVPLKNKYDGEQFIDKVKAELLDRQYSTEVINEWLSYL